MNFFDLDDAECAGPNARASEMAAEIGAVFLPERRGFYPEDTIEEPSLNDTTGFYPAIGARRSAYHPPKPLWAGGPPAGWSKQNYLTWGRAHHPHLHNMVSHRLITQQEASALLGAPGAPHRFVNIHALTKKATPAQAHAMRQDERAMAAVQQDQAQAQDVQAEAQEDISATQQEEQVVQQDESQLQAAEQQGQNEEPEIAQDQAILAEDQGEVQEDVSTIQEAQEDQAQDVQAEQEISADESAIYGAEASVDQADQPDDAPIEQIEPPDGVEPFDPDAESSGRGGGRGGRGGRRGGKKHKRQSSGPPDPSDDGGDEDDGDDSSGFDPPQGAFHLGQGALPSHEAGIDCRIRIWRDGAIVKGVCSCDTSYGRVTLAAKGDSRVVGKFVEMLSKGVAPQVAAGAAFAKTERAVRRKLFDQAQYVPTASADPSVKSATELAEAAASQDQSAVGALEHLSALERSGDSRAAASKALVRAVVRNGIAQSSTTGCGGMPTYHRAPIIVGGSTPRLTAHEHSALSTLLDMAIRLSVSPIHRLPPPRGHFQ